MKIKMIVMDMDGTLLNHDQLITPKTKAALINAEKKGAILVLASGRSYRTLTSYGNELAMPSHNGYFICVNGAAITDVSTMDTKVIQQLQLSEIKEIYDAIKPYEIEAMGVLDDTIYDLIPTSVMDLKKIYREANQISDDVPWTAGTFSMIVDQRKGYNHIHYIKDSNEIPVPVNKICLAHEADKLVDVYEYLTKHFGTKYHFARTSPMWIECAPYGINKGNTIKMLANKLNIKTDEILVFGDGENDLSMFDVVKYSVAMGNAMPLVKERANAVTNDNNHDGIAEYLEANNI